MYPEDDYILLSAIQHYIFCPRQCGLIHIDGLRAENMFTARGAVMHEKADSGEDEYRNDRHIVRSLSVYSRRLGLSGKCDIVEMTGRGEIIIPYPVEYKSGKPKMDISDTAQLCAQVLCLEEMMHVSILEAAIFYGRPRRRMPVSINESLRCETESIIEKIHFMIARKEVPAATYSAKCNNCSMNQLCMPRIKNAKVKKYIEELYKKDETTS